MNHYAKSMSPHASNIMIMNYLEWFGPVEDSQPGSMKEFLEQLIFFFSVIEKKPHTPWGTFVHHLVKTEL